MFHIVHIPCCLFWWYSQLKFSPDRIWCMSWSLVEAFGHWQKPTPTNETPAPGPGWEIIEVWILGISAECFQHITLYHTINFSSLYWVHYVPILALCPHHWSRKSKCGTCLPAWNSLIKGIATRPAMQTASVKAFFVHLYWTAAESMTTKNLGNVQFCMTQRH
jgi:hypothetical protein